MYPCDCVDGADVVGAAVCNRVWHTDEARMTKHGTTHQATLQTFDTDHADRLRRKAENKSNESQSDVKQMLDGTATANDNGKAKEKPLWKSSH